jgi:hypothetical protein
MQIDGQVETPADNADEPKRTKAEQKRLILVEIDTGEYRLQYPLAFAQNVSALELYAAIEAGMKRVEDLLGPFESKLELLVPGQIVFDDPSFPSHLGIAGLTQEADDGTIQVVVSLWAAKGSTWPHEFFHARLRELELAPPRWLEEGAAHFVESANGFNEELFELLLSSGPLSIEDISKIRGISDKEMRVRASGWAVVYYLNKIRGKKLQHVMLLQEVDLPSTAEAFEAIKEERNKMMESNASNKIAVF